MRFGAAMYESATLLEYMRRRLAVHLGDEGADAAIALAWQRARETTCSPLESLSMTLVTLARAEPISSRLGLPPTAPIGPWEFGWSTT